MERVTGTTFYALVHREHFQEYRQRIELDSAGKHRRSPAPLAENGLRRKARQPFPASAHMKPERGVQSPNLCGTRLRAKLMVRFPLASKPPFSSPEDWDDRRDRLSTLPTERRPGGTRSQQSTPRVLRKRPGAGHRVPSESSRRLARRAVSRPKRCLHPRWWAIRRREP